jgi:hypothetical protein
MRWEVFAESLQDQALLQTLGVEPKGRALAMLHSFEDFPKSEAWIHATRKAVLLAPRAPEKCKSKRSGGEAASTPQQSEAATADASATGTLAL